MVNYSETESEGKLSVEISRVWDLNKTGQVIIISKKIAYYLSNSFITPTMYLITLL